jgi:hypothetical protein
MISNLPNLVYKYIPYTSRSPCEGVLEMNDGYTVVRIPG